MTAARTAATSVPLPGQTLTRASWLCSRWSQVHSSMIGVTPFFLQSHRSRGTYLGCALSVRQVWQVATGARV